MVGSTTTSRATSIAESCAPMTLDAIKCVPLPVGYQIPHKGPVGAMLKAMDRHSWRPAHVHFKVRADGFHTPNLVAPLFYCSV
jgi:protocatechuate 3,4-dioxygenase beta subunit